MTFTPLAAADASMAAPEPESRASTRSTLAPWVIMASAWVCIVCALPWALSILKSLLDRPAAWNAFSRYGRSNDSYRADVSVSGRSTPIMPLPLLATSFRSAMAEKSAVNDSAEIDAGEALASVVVVLSPDEALSLLSSLPQAASANKESTATPAAAPRLNETFIGCVPLARGHRGARMEAGTTPRSRFRSGTVDAKETVVNEV